MWLWSAVLSVVIVMINDKFCVFLGCALKHDVEQCKALYRWGGENLIINCNLRVLVTMVYNKSRGGEYPVQTCIAKL